jgi:hypothetical protein
MIAQKQDFQTFTAVFSGLSIVKTQPERSTFMGTIGHRLFTALSHWVIARCDGDSGCKVLIAAVLFPPSIDPLREPLFVAFGNHLGSAPQNQI